MKLHGEEVKVGDRVWHLLQGWGEVTDIEEGSRFNICVRWEEDYDWFTKDGKASIYEVIPTIFWQPIEFKIPKKPKPKEKAWQWICKSGEIYWLTYCHYASVESLLKCLPKAEPIAPYLPSEIEREKSE